MQMSDVIQLQICKGVNITTFALQILNVYVIYVERNLKIELRNVGTYQMRNGSKQFTLTFTLSK